MATYLSVSAMFNSCGMAEGSLICFGSFSVLNNFWCDTVFTSVLKQYEINLMI